MRPESFAQMSLCAVSEYHHIRRVLLDADSVLQKEGQSLDFFFGDVAVKWVSSQDPQVVLGLEEQSLRRMPQLLSLEYGLRNIPRVRNPRRHPEGYVGEGDQERLIEVGDEVLDEEGREGLVDGNV